MKLFKSENKRLYLSYDHTWVQLIYVLPALTINWVTDESSLMFLGEGENDYIGKKLSITFNWLIFDFNLDYWWNLKERNYDDY
jgi:hypothetical protein